MRQSDLSGEVRQYVDEAIGGAYAIAGKQISALSNYWSIVGKTVHAQTAPATSIVAGVFLTPRVSGVFRIDVDVGWSDGNNGDTVTWAISQDQATVKGQIFTAGGTTPVVTGQAVGKVIAGADQGFIQSAASGLTVTAPVGGSAGLTPIDGKTYDTLTGLLANSDQFYGVHAIIDSLAQPGGIGRQCAFLVTVNATHNITIPSLTLCVQELPA